MEALNQAELSSAFVGLIAGWLFLAAVIFGLVLTIVSQSRRIKTLEKRPFVSSERIRQLIYEEMRKKPDFRGNRNATALIVGWCMQHFVQIRTLRSVEDFLKRAHHAAQKAKEYEAGMERASNLQARFASYQAELRQSVHTMIQTYIKDIRDQTGGFLTEKDLIDVVRKVDIQHFRSEEEIRALIRTAIQVRQGHEQAGRQAQIRSRSSDEDSSAPKAAEPFFSPSAAAPAVRSPSSAPPPPGLPKVPAPPVPMQAVPAPPQSIMQGAPSTKKGVGPAPDDDMDDHPTLNFHPDDDDSRATNIMPQTDDDSRVTSVMPQTVDESRRTVPRHSPLEKASLGPGQPGYQAPSTSQQTAITPPHLKEELAARSRRTK